MVTAPATAAAYKENGKTADTKARLRLWIRLLRASRLVAEGFVARSQRDGDRRTSFITLTRRGRAAFAAMAAAHEGWIDELLDGVSARDAEQLSAKLKSFRSEWEAEA